MPAFPLNAWYAAAWDADIKHALFPRTICGKHVVMYRKADGSVAALEDACWHRLVPLSKGRLEGVPLVGDDAPFDHLEATGLEESGERLAAAIDTRAGHDTVADGEHLGPKRRVRSIAHRVLRYRTRIIPSVPASCGSTLHPTPSGRHSPSGGSAIGSKASGTECSTPSSASSVHTL